jgi:hypothetical protein
VMLADIDPIEADLVSGGSGLDDGPMALGGSFSATCYGVRHQVTQRHQTELHRHYTSTKLNLSLLGLA